MVVNTRYFAEHVVDWVAANGKGFCGHQDPEEPDGRRTARARTSARLGCRTAGAATWTRSRPDHRRPLALRQHGSARRQRVGPWSRAAKSNGNGYQVQDIGTDHAYMTVVIEKEALTTPSSNVRSKFWARAFMAGPTPCNRAGPSASWARCNRSSSARARASWAPPGSLGARARLSTERGRRAQAPLRAAQGRRRPHLRDLGQHLRRGKLPTR